MKTVSTFCRVSAHNLFNDDIVKKIILVGIKFVKLIEQNESIINIYPEICEKLTSITCKLFLFSAGYEDIIFESKSNFKLISNPKVHRVNTLNHVICFRYRKHSTIRLHCQI